MFGEEEEEDKPKRKLIKLQYTDEEQRAMEAAQKQVKCHFVLLLPVRVWLANVCLLEMLFVSAQHCLAL